MAVLLRNNSEQFVKLWEHVTHFKGGPSPVLQLIHDTLLVVTAEHDRTGEFDRRPLYQVAQRIGKRVELDQNVVGCVWMTEGEWHITNRDMEFWADVCFFGNRDFLPRWWSLYSSDISAALETKRRWQALCRYRLNGGLREEHRKLAAKLRFDVDCWRGDWASIYVDGKRPMGNSSREYDMAAALGWEIPENQDGEREMPPDMAELCWDLFDELPFAIHDMICTVVIDAA